METPPPVVHVDPVPPPKGWRAVWRHLQNWQSIYLFVPMALFSIWLFAEFAYFLSGRRPQENADWMVGNAGNLLKMVYLIVFLEIMRQQTGIWWKREELILHPHLGWQQTCTKCVTLLVGAYILLH